MSKGGEGETVMAFLRWSELGDIKENCRACQFLHVISWVEVMGCSSLE